MAVRRSTRSISELMDMRPDYANLKKENEVIRVSPDEVKPGDSIVVKPGERIPLDGIVCEGRSALDTSALSGESLPRDVESGSEVLSGSVNISGMLTITVTKKFGDSTVSRIFELVRNTEHRKAPVENFISRFARHYTPAVVIAALALALLPPLFFGGTWQDWTHRACIFLVISCPCALVISIPLSFFGGIGGASRRGILIKGGNYLSALNDVETVVFDKTGTLTTGRLTVTGIHNENGFSAEELLYFVAAAESNSSHPIAKSIMSYYGGKIPPGEISSCEEIAGRGIRACVRGKTVLAGNIGFLENSRISPRIANEAGTAVHAAIDGTYAGCIVISDTLKPDSARAVAELRKAGVRRIIMLSGDNSAAAEKTGAELALDKVYAELLPHQKVQQLEALQKKTSPGKKLAFVGDGINDAPALALCDIGIAMGGLGSDAAIEAADIVLMTDEPLRLADALAIAWKTKQIVWQNIVFALGVKAAILVLGALGMANMWEAVFGDVGVALITVLNAMRALKINSLANLGRGIS
jgi:Cd2+/Zn2+-exporting ATPase